MATFEKSIDVNVPVRTAYNQWTQFEEFPRFMDSVREVRQLDDTHLHWCVEAGGKQMEWDAEIIEQVPDQCIAWQTTNGAPRSSAKVQFKPVDEQRTTIVFTMDYPNGVGKNGKSQDVAARAEEDLKRFAQYVEHRGQETGAWRGEVHGGQEVSGQDGGQEVSGRDGGQNQQADSGQGPDGNQRAEGQDVAGEAFQQAQNLGQQVAEGAQAVGRQAQDSARAMGQQAQDTARAVGEQTQAWGRAWGEQAQNVAGTVRQQAETVAGGVKQAQEAALGLAGQAMDEAQQAFRRNVETLMRFSPLSMARAGAGSQPGSPSTWFSSMLTAFEEPFSMMRRLTEQMDREMETFMWGAPGTIRRTLAARTAPMWTPSIDVAQQGQELVVTADLPGVAAEDLDVQINEGHLVIAGERRSETASQSRGVQLVERTCGRFMRSIPLPEGIQAGDAQATMNEGVLEIRLPLPSEKQRRIEVRSGPRPEASSSSSSTQQQAQGPGQQQPVQARPQPQDPQAQYKA